ncbi:MAG: hypothetical protein KDJ41_14735 [Hyphomicrobiaceae bacterium]|nr:hypothetical protein [Hyphomicrobiaceae bacterium]
MTSELELKSKEPSMLALGYILDAWDEGTENGVPPELMAYAALYTALTDLVSSYGEDAVATLARGLVDRVRTGEFSVSRTYQ